MDVLIPAIFISVDFVLFLVMERRDSPIGKWIKNRWQSLSQKFVVAFLLGFILFALISDKIPTWPQKLGLSLVALLLILANSIHLPFHKEC